MTEPNNTLTFHMIPATEETQPEDPIQYICNFCEGVFITQEEIGAHATGGHGLHSFVTTTTPYVKSDDEGTA